MLSIFVPPGLAMIRTHIGPILGPRSIGYRGCPARSNLRKSSSSSAASPHPDSTSRQTEPFPDAKLSAILRQALASGP